jgi:hypothetical protein
MGNELVTLKLRPQLDAVFFVRPVDSVTFSFGRESNGPSVPQLTLDLLPCIGLRMQFFDPAYDSLKFDSCFRLPTLHRLPPHGLPLPISRVFDRLVPAGSEHNGEEKQPENQMTAQHVSMVAH